jgi:predicted ATPase
LHDLDLAVGPLTVIVGPNGAGKSSLLELFGLIGSIHQGSEVFTTAFARYGGYRATLSYFARDPRISLGITCNRNGTPEPEFAYDVDFLEEGAGSFVASEKLLTPTFGLERVDTNVEGESARGGYVLETIRKGERGSFTIDHGPKLALHEVPRARAELERRFDFGKRIRLFRTYRFQPDERLRAPQRLQLTEVPANDGMDLLSALYGLKTERPGTYDEIIGTLQVAIPEFEGLDFPLAGDGGYVHLRWKHMNLPKPFGASQLSDGILRLLWIVTILHSVPDDGLVMFDEPELSLHPQWLMLLVSLMRKTSVRTNILVATQSAELLSWLKPNELVIADMTEQGTIFTPASSKPDLNKWLEDFTLSELWTMGELGGRR